MTLKVFDQNRFSQPAFEGIAQINVHELLSAPPGAGGVVVEKWLPLQPYQADIDVGGDVHVQVRVEDGS